MLVNTGGYSFQFILKFMEFLHSMGAKQKTSHFPNPPGVHPSTALLSVATSAKVTSKKIVVFGFREGFFSRKKKNPGAKKLNVD